MNAALPRKIPACAARWHVPRHVPRHVPWCVSLAPLLLIGALILLPAMPAHAQERAYGDVIVQRGEVEDNVSTSIGEVRIYGEVLGDVETEKGNVWVEGRVGGDVDCAMGNVFVNAPVGGDVTAHMGDVYVNDRVAGEISTGGGNVYLSESARVNSKVSANGRIQKHPEAEIRGPRIAGMAPGFSEFSSDEDSDGPGFAGWLLGALALSGGSVLLAVVLPRPLHASARALDGSPLWSLLLGVASLPGLVVLAILLAISVVGIPLLVLIAPAYLALVFFGACVAAYSLGRKTLFAARRYHGGDAWAAAVGALMLAVVYLIPFLGQFLVFILALTGAGAAILALLPRRHIRPTYSPYEDLAGSR